MYMMQEVILRTLLLRVVADVCCDRRVCLLNCQLLSAFAKLRKSTTSFEFLPVCLSIRLQYFSTLSHKRHAFLKKKLLIIKCVFGFSPQLLSETLSILQRTEQDIIINVYRSSCKVPVILVRF